MLLKDKMLRYEFVELTMFCTSSEERCIDRSGKKCSAGWNGTESHGKDSQKKKLSS